jgi:hypothetical protein
MTRRVTLAFVEAQLDRLNTLAGTPLTPCDPHSTAVKWQKGNYHLNSGYNGWCVVQVTSLSGGIEIVSKNGYCSLRENSIFLQAFIDGFTHGYLNCSNRAARSRADSSPIPSAPTRRKTS